MVDFIYNGQIKSNFVVLISEDGEKLGQMEFKKAMSIADERNMDLIQVSEGDKYPICKLGDVGKMKYKESKKEKHNRAENTIKEIKFHLATSIHDIDIKNKKVMELLKKGHPVKYVIERNKKKKERFVKENAEKLIKIYSENFKEHASLSELMYGDMSVCLMIKPN